MMEVRESPLKGLTPVESFTERILKSALEKKSLQARKVLGPTLRASLDYLPPDSPVRREVEAYFGKQKRISEALQKETY